MRAANKTPAETRERYLGEIAPLLEAARDLEALSGDRKRQVRRRIMRSAFGRRSRGGRSHLMPLLAALGLLAAGGAAFAMAEHFGLLPRLGFRTMGPPTLPPMPTGHRHGATHGGSARGSLPEPWSGGVSPLGSEVAPAPPVQVALVPSLPDPLLPELAGGGPFRTARPEAPSVRAHGTPKRHVSMPESRPTAEHDAAQVAPRRLAHATASVAPAQSEWSIPAQSGSYWARPGATSAGAAPVEPSRVVAFDPPAPPAATARASALAPTASATHSAPPTPSERHAPSDQALFAQALHRLRSEGDAASALSALHDHARLFPSSAFAGERTALEIESLLALHRNREALTLLDAMVIEDLPRSGERFVVRGELRASARRWQEANADFERALAQVSGSPTWHERALWGRAVTRLRLGEREAGMADVERYLDSYPHGRYAREAAKLVPEK
jgi:hypothetical protein